MSGCSGDRSRLPLGAQQALQLDAVDASWHQDCRLVRATQGPPESPKSSENGEESVTKALAYREDRYTFQTATLH